MPFSASGLLILLILWAEGERVSSQTSGKTDRELQSQWDSSRRILINPLFPLMVSVSVSVHCSWIEHYTRPQADTIHGTHTRTHTGKEKPLLLTCCTSVSPFDVFSVYTNELKILCREKEAETVRLDQEECRRFGSNNWKPSPEEEYWQGSFIEIDFFGPGVAERRPFVINTLGLHLLKLMAKRGQM